MTEQTLQLLTVTLGDQYFGLDARAVNAILLRQDATSVPQAANGIAGLINVRGHIVTLVDVRTCLGMAGEDTARMNVTISHGGEVYGLLFDTVGDIIEFDAAAMEPVPAVLDERWQGMASGIFRRPDSLVIMLDAERIATRLRPPAGDI